MIDAHWRNTQKPIRFAFLDARVGIFILVFLLYIRMSTLLLMVAFIIVFAILERRGLNFNAAMRAARRWTLGVARPANHRRAMRRWVEYSE